MLRIFLGLLLGGGGGLAASHLAVAELFNIDFWSLAQSSDKRLIAFAVVAGLPLLVILLRGWIGFLVSTLFILLAFAFQCSGQSFFLGLGNSRRLLCCDNGSGSPDYLVGNITTTSY